MRKALALIAASLIMLAGCAQKTISKSDTQDNVINKQEQQRNNTDQKQTGKIPSMPVESVDSNNSATARNVQDNMFKDILFDYDRYDIAGADRQTLRTVSDFLSKHPEAQISVEGHCDERGTGEYNLALGDRRAKAVKDYLVSLGIASKKIDTISYGEERPSCKESSESCWSKNRRAHFVVLGPRAD